MQKARLFLVIFTANLLLAVPCHGESLTIIDEMTLSADKTAYTGKGHGKLHVIGVYLAGDTTLVSTNIGILARFSREQPWRKILDREPYGNNWWEDFKKAKKENVVFSPGYLWRMPGTDEIVVFDDYMSAAYLLHLQDPDNVKVRFWKRPDEKSPVNAVSTYDDLIFYGIESDFHDSVLAVSHPDLSDYHRVFECPPAPMHKFDSVWADPDCFPAFNPIDSTV